MHDIQVLRILIGLLCFTRNNSNSSLKGLNYSGGNYSYKRRSSGETDDIENFNKTTSSEIPVPFMGELIGQEIRSSPWRDWLLKAQRIFWLLFPYTPLVTALPAPILIAISLGKSDFKEVHGESFRLVSLLIDLKPN